MKTIEEAAIENRNKEIGVGSANDAVFNSRIGMQILIDKTFVVGVEFAQQWIDVNEELPTVNEDSEFDLKYGFSKEVIVKMKDDCYAIGVYCANSKSFSLKGSTLAYKITHWRPINRK